MSKHWIFAAGIIIGFSTLAAWRLATYTSDSVHYHANFTVYVNGERETFSAETYYEETAGCSLDASANPTERTHMHANMNDLVHVHAPAVTWGHFFQNLGWGIGAGYLQTREQLLVADSRHPLTYLLNGERLKNPGDLVIGSEDRLLVSYGTTDEAELTAQFNSIASTAAEQNVTQDPASCGGTTSAGWRERLEHILR